MRLIDADKLERRIRKYAEDCYEVEDAVSAQVFEDVVCEIQDEKSVDAVEVVRCNDCKNVTCHSPSGLYCQKFQCYMKETDFCSFGEIKKKL